jgi:hypothetical protein
MSREIRRPRPNHQSVPPIRKTIRGFADKPLVSSKSRREMGRSKRKIPNPVQPFASNLKLSKQAQMCPNESNVGKIKLDDVKVFLMRSHPVAGCPRSLAVGAHTVLRIAA